MSSTCNRKRWFANIAITWQRTPLCRWNRTIVSSCKADAPTPDQGRLQRLTSTCEGEPGNQYSTSISPAAGPCTGNRPGILPRLCSIRSRRVVERARYEVSIEKTLRRWRQSLEYGGLRKLHRRYRQLSERRETTHCRSRQRRPQRGGERETRRARVWSWQGLACCKPG